MPCAVSMSLSRKNVVFMRELLAYLSATGDMDFAIAIRTMILKNQKAYVQAGAGVVYDSVPENEFYETINKAKAMTRIGDAQ